MKILKRISLHRGLDRITETAKSHGRFEHYLYRLTMIYQIPIQQQLHKYGVRPSYISTKHTLFYLLGGLVSICWLVYQEELYKNQLDTIYRYRVIQYEHSPITLRLRIWAIKVIMFFENNFHVTAFFKKSKMGQPQFQTVTQGILRYDQYQYFMKNKDTKFDFLDIGVLEKFPYVKQQDQSE